MSSTIIATPENLQLQSPLARLPAEIKHIIYNLCFQTDVPIVDPVVSSSSDQAKGQVNPALGLSLLQTCRRMYHEADRRPLYFQNRFRFTTLDCMRAFLNSLDVAYRSCVEDVDIDFCNLSSDSSVITREWQQYLSCGKAETLGSLRIDAPGVKCVRLNFTSWPTIPMFRTELWNLLRNLVSNLEGLDRIVVVGASKGRGMAKKAPWSPVHFVGGDDVGSDDLVSKMRSAVRGSDSSKTIRWVREDGKLHLEVVSTDYLLHCVDKSWKGPSQRSKHTDAWPHSGSCSIPGYDNRDSDVTEPRTKGVNPSAAG